MSPLLTPTLLCAAAVAASVLASAAVALQGSSAPAAEPAAAAPATTPMGHVETRGTGPVHLILIPGLNSDWSVFEEFMARNGEKYTMHAVTLPGFGGTEAPPVPEGASYSGGLWMENAQRAALALIAEKKMGKPVVVGHSMGGYLAMKIAAERPDMVAGAVAIDSFAAFPIAPPGMPLDAEARRQAVDTMIAPGIAAQPDEQFKASMGEMFTTMMKDPARAKAFAEKAQPIARATTTRYLLELFAGDLTAAMQQNTRPTLVLAAIEDPASPEAGQVKEIWEGQFKGMPNTSLVFVENSRHFITEDQPARLDEEIGKFVAALPRE